MADVTISAAGSFYQAVAGAHSLTLSSYILGKDTELLLEQAAQRGAQVHVILSGRCVGSHNAALEQVNLDCVSRLRAAGVQAQLSTGQLLHLKAAIVDDVVFLDTCNWTGKDEVVICDRQANDILAVQKVFDGLFKDEVVLSPPAQVALEKSAALHLEDDLLQKTTAAKIDIATETLGPSTVASSLAAVAQRCKVRLLVAKSAYEEDGSTLAEVLRLQKAGVEVRMCGSHEKFAVAGSEAWIGSANISGAMPHMLDWGVRLNDADAAHEIEERFQQAWEKGRDRAVGTENTRAE